MKEISFSPNDPSKWNCHLPAPIQRQLNVLDHDYKQWQRYEDGRVRRGRPAGDGVYDGSVVLFADSEHELQKRVGHLDQILGPKGVGNRRRAPAMARVYADLLEIFYRLQAKNICLPRGGSLSSKAVQAGLGQVLKSHGYTNHSTEWLAKDTAERRRLGKVMKKHFARIADVIE